MITAYKKFWQNYSNFSGRSNRPDYWWSFLANFLISLPFTIALSFSVLSAFIAVLPYTSDEAMREVTEEMVATIFLQELFTPFNLILIIIMVVFSLAVFIPHLAITVRRLRDAGFHWAFIFVNFVPYVGSIILLILLAQKTKEPELVEDTLLDETE